MCGDVWKTIVHLRATRDDLRVFVLNCDYGLGIIRPGTPGSALVGVAVEEIADMTYRDLVRHREDYVNLKPVAYLDDFLARL